MVDEQTEPWGIKVSTVEIKDVEIPEAMQRAMARQAEAERERRAKIINAEGEFQAAERLAGAAEIIGREPQAIQLRYLQTLLELGTDQNSTIVFPLPIDLLKPFLEPLRAAASRAGPTSRSCSRRAASRWSPVQITRTAGGGCVAVLAAQIVARRPSTSRPSASPSGSSGSGTRPPPRRLSANRRTSRSSARRPRAARGGPPRGRPPAVRRPLPEFEHRVGREPQARHAGDQARDLGEGHRL